MVERVASRRDFDELRRRGVGYIYNDRVAPPGEDKYPGILHTASCRTLERSSSTSWQEKLFAADLSDLVAWLQRKRGSEGDGWRRCAVCVPPRIAIAGSQAGGFVYNNKGPADQEVWDRSLCPAGVLHVSDCRALAGVPVQNLKGFSDWQTAVRWLRAQRGPEGDGWHSCGLCRPAPARRQAAATVTEDLWANLQTLIGSARTTREAASSATVGAVGDDDGSRKTDGRGVKASAPGDGRLDAADEGRASRDSLAIATEDAQQAGPVDGQRDDDSSGVGSPFPGDEAELSRLRAELAELQTAWQTVVRENDALRLQAESQTGELAAARTRINELEARPVDDDRPDGGTPGFEAARRVGTLIAASGIALSARISAVDDLVTIVGTDSELREMQVSLLIMAGRDREALSVMGAVDASSAPEFVRAAVIASLRSRQLPKPLDLLARVDWGDAELLRSLRDAASHLDIDRALDVLESTVDTLPVPTASELLETLSERRCSDAQVGRLIELWGMIDQARAIRRLLIIAEQRPLADGGVLLAALRSITPDAPHAAQVARLLLAHAESVGSVADVQELGTRFAKRVPGRSGLELRGEILDALIRMSDDVTTYESAAIDAAELEGLWRLDGEGDMAGRWAQKARLIADRLPRESRAAVLELLSAPDPGAAAEGVAIPTVERAVEFVERKYAALVFLPMSPGTCRAGTERVLDVLERLGTLAGRWQAEDLDIWTELGQLGCEFRPSVSETARTKHRRWYERTLPDGRCIQLSPHLVVGNRTHLCRIYLYVDLEGRRIVVGDITSHGPDKSTS